MPPTIRPHLSVVPPAERWPARRPAGRVEQAHRVAEIDAMRAACDAAAGLPQQVRSLRPMAVAIVVSWIVFIFGAVMAWHLIAKAL